MADTSFIKKELKHEIDVKQGDKVITIFNNDIYDGSTDYDNMGIMAVRTSTCPELDKWTIIESEEFPDYINKSLQELCDFLNTETINENKDNTEDSSDTQEMCKQELLDISYTNEVADISEETESITDTVLKILDEINSELDKLEKDNLLSKSELVKIRLLHNEVHVLTYMLLGNEDKICIKLSEINKTIGNISNVIEKLISKIDELLHIDNNDKTKDIEITPSKELSYNCDFNKEVKLEDGINFDILKTLMRVKGAILIKGAPGSGKTTAMEHFAKTVVKEQNGTEDQIEFVQFSSSYSYTHIIDGLVSENGVWKIKDGTLQKLCKRAIKNPNKQYFYLIDEINRADTESVVGELLNCIERRDKEITTKNGNKMRIPSNICIIATMNEFDSGTKKLDSATLSRFAIISMNTVNMDAEFVLTKKGINDNEHSELNNALELLIEYMKNANRYLEKSKFLGKENCIGFRDLFTDYNTLEELSPIIEYCIIENINRNIKTLSISDSKKVNEIIDQIKELCIHKE